MGEEDTAQVEDECGDDWLVSQIISPEEQQRRLDQKIEEEFDTLEDEFETQDGSEENVEEKFAKMDVKDDSKNADAPGNEEEDEYADMEEFEDDTLIEDEAVAVTDVKENPVAEDNILKVRTYDLSITYDKYYQTPRVWMMGYTSVDSSQPLTGEEMMQDVMSGESMYNSKLCLFVPALIYSICCFRLCEPDSDHRSPSPCGWTTRIDTSMSTWGRDENNRKEPDESS